MIKISDDDVKLLIGALSIAITYLENRINHVDLDAKVNLENYKHQIEILQEKLIFE